MRPHHLLSIYAKRHELARTGEPVASPFSRVARGDGISLRPECAATGGVDVPPRYLGPEAEAVTGAGDGNGNGEAQIPIIDHRRLLLELDRRGEESSRLHRACQDWGFFQMLTNGRYRSIEHRVVVDPEEERLSVAAFHSPNTRATEGARGGCRRGRRRGVWDGGAWEAEGALLGDEAGGGKSFLERMKLPSRSSS